MFWINARPDGFGKTVARVLAAALVLSVGAAPAWAESFAFVALGDLPYGFDATAGARYRALIQTINATNPVFSVHVGDFKAGYTACSDEEYALQKKHFDQFEQALIYTPGDNDWTDCHRVSNGGYDPVERLNKLREVFYDPVRSLGQRPIRVESQPQVMPKFKTYVENQRWQVSRTLFVTLHIVGSNNNYDRRSDKAVKEYRARDLANIAWIQEAFRYAREFKIEAIVFAYQANTFMAASLYETYPPESGFRNTVARTLLPLARDFKKPVLIIHGDSHGFKFNQPFFLDQKRVPNVFRLEVPGDFSTEAVRVEVTEGRADPFTVRLLDTSHR